jgi:hypothetical protein
VDNSITNSWEGIFATATQTDFSLSARVIKKAGAPFIVLPEPAPLAAKGLALYPAQTGFAKIAKGALQIALRARVPIKSQKVKVALSLGDPFPRFIKEVSRVEPFPNLAILLGNPSAAGRRFIMLLFDEADEPALVVKVGIVEPARRLIRAESDFLQSARDVPGLPIFRGHFASGSIEAFALDYVAGDSPLVAQRHTIEQLMMSWLDRNQKIVFDQVPAWKTLADDPDPMVRRIAEKLAGLRFHPTLYHGDFAPWNIKVSRSAGEWTMLDWERGNRVGFPGWDWIHYVVQAGILVDKMKPRRAFRELEDLLRDPVFVRYAEAAEIAGHEAIFAIAYLLYCVNIIRPGESLTVTRAVLKLMIEKYF